MAASTPEGKIVKALLAHIKSLGRAHAVKVHGGRYSSGQPDVLACIDGRMVQVEAKVPGNKPTPRQMVNLRAWEASGALAGWVTSVEGLEDLLSHLDEPGWVNPQLARGTGPAST